MNAKGYDWAGFGCFVFCLLSGFALLVFAVGWAVSVA